MNRYSPELMSQGAMEPEDCWAEMEVDPDGDYVRFADVQTLERQVHALTVENEHLRARRDRLVAVIGNNGEVIADIHRYMAETSKSLAALEARIRHLDVMARYTE